MTTTWRLTPVPIEDAFAAIKAGIDALPPGVNMFLNSGSSFDIVSLPELTRRFEGEFYGQDFTVVNLELVARFFEK